MNKNCDGFTFVEVVGTIIYYDRLRSEDRLMGLERLILVCLRASICAKIFLISLGETRLDVHPASCARIVSGDDSRSLFYTGWSSEKTWNLSIYSRLMYISPTILRSAEQGYGSLKTMFIAPIGQYRFTVIWKQFQYTCFGEEGSIITMFSYRWKLVLSI